MATATDFLASAIILRLLSISVESEIASITPIGIHKAVHSLTRLCVAHQAFYIYNGVLNNGLSLNTIYLLDTHYYIERPSFYIWIYL